ncbi:hypothetical protein OPV22_021095 [Ensete ventricosum]|uniref:Uncharacterized protein n=1 Tax=Ensete ventricosum TaxID=4639 RepID=A0AAV8QLP0_ENSVE|nr:hypothetical protein OPV22_021095 [Ensete ventricosum]
MHFSSSRQRDHFERLDSWGKDAIRIILKRVAIYKVPGTLLVEPFSDMLLPIYKEKLPRGHISPRHSLEDRDHCLSFSQIEVGNDWHCLRCKERNGEAAASVRLKSQNSWIYNSVSCTECNAELERDCWGKGSTHEIVFFVLVSSVLPLGIRQRDSSKEGREVVRMRRTARRHQHKGNGQTCSGSRKTLSSLFCFPGLNATQTQPVPSFRHDWGDSIMHSSMQVAPLLLACSCHHKVPIAEVGFSNAKNNRMN